MLQSSFISCHIFLHTQEKNSCSAVQNTRNLVVYFAFHVVGLDWAVCLKSSVILKNCTAVIIIILVSNNSYILRTQVNVFF